MKDRTFDRSKYNLSWISVTVIFVGTIIYPIFFARTEGSITEGVVQITPTPVTQVTKIENPVTKIKSAPRPTFTRDLKVGDKGPDVKKLQQYLNQRGFIVATSGNGSPGQETELFGPGTAEALKKFQEVYAEILLKPYGLSEGTGFFGEKTRNFINS